MVTSLHSVIYEPTCPDVDGTYRIHHAPFKIGGLYHIDPASREANNRTVIALYDDAGLFRGEVKVAAGTDLWWKLVKDAQYRAGAVFCPYNKGMDMGDGVYEGEGQFLESIPGGLASRVTGPPPRTPHNSILGGPEELMGLLAATNPPTGAPAPATATPAPPPTGPLPPTPSRPSTAAGPAAGPVGPVGLAAGPVGPVGPPPPGGGMLGWLWRLLEALLALVR